MKLPLTSLWLVLLTLCAPWWMVVSCGKREATPVFDKQAAKVCFLIHTPEAHRMEINILSSFGSFHEPPGIGYSIRQTSKDDSGTAEKVPGPVIIDGKPQMIQQCGTYDIVVSANGDITRISGFRYSGEKNMEVARGIGWSLYVSKDKWIQELVVLQ